ncbi:MAG: ATP-binding cassette domain-containing protein, partial [Paraburkholderia sp.]|nr:ATP-binding cassette domain-containing protein [Paraburkholderia sp.]
MASANAMLEVRGLHAYYGKSHILHGVEMQVGEGEIVALLGRNGVGRSTLAKAIMGLVRCEGHILLRGQDVRGLRTFEIAHRGIGYVPENRDIFPTLTVRQNLMLGEKRKRSRQQSRWRLDEMYRLFPRLKEREHTAA